MKNFGKIKQKNRTSSNKNLRNILRYTAFTLAEVLIVVAIIGIIAEITIPALVQNVAKQQYVALSQKVWSESQQFLRQYMFDQGIYDLADANFTDVSSFDTEIKKYFKIAEFCSSGNPSCIITENYLSKAGTITADYTSRNSSLYFMYSFISTDGMLVAFQFYVTSGAVCRPVTYPSGKIQKWCGTLTIDVNGSKGPNIDGRDFLNYFLIAQDGTLYPEGGHDWSYAFYGSDSNYWRNYPYLCGYPGSSDMTNGGTGVLGACIARIMENSWQMDY